MKTLSILLALLISSTLVSASENFCERKSLTVLNTKISTMKLTNGNCYLSLHPKRTVDLVYRDFMFSDEGLIMMFDSYGNGPGSRFTGARSFYTYPHKTSPTYTINGSQLLITLIDGNVFSFDLDLYQPTFMSNAVISYISDVKPALKGGLEIDSKEGLLIDLGHRIGADPSTRRNYESTFTDVHNRSCKVNNNKFIKLVAGEPSLIFTDNQTINLFVREHCPNLSL